MKKNTLEILQQLSDELNATYGTVHEPGDNYGEPAINSGPCGPFAKVFMEQWNARFSQHVYLVFVMLNHSDECWHILIRLPDGQLYDGGYGVHADDRYPQDKFNLTDMHDYDEQRLEQYAHGLDREYPRYCPNFSLVVVTQIVEKHLDRV